jgi:biopolymer transport protein ExbD
MAMNLNPGTRQCATINITPMIDVLLVLLIIFMAIAPPKAVGLDALIPLPPHNAANDPPEDPVVLEIDATGTYRLNTIPVDRAALAERLTAIYAHRANHILFVKAAPDLEFRAVASAIDIAHGVSVDRVALMPR